jgi:hypothetical protein
MEGEHAEKRFYLLQRKKIAALQSRSCGRNIYIVTKKSWPFP